jgi:hypothetical protein
MKKLDKATLVELIEKVREYWSGNKTTDEAKTLLNEACAVSEKLLPPNQAMELRVFIQSIVGYFGLKPDVTNEEIFGVLALLDWEVE